MKKSIIALVLVVAMAVAGPVAAAGINFSGSVETNVEVNRNEGVTTVTPSSELELSMDFNAAEGNIKAVMEFGLVEADEDEDEIMPTQLTLADIELKKAYIETEGAFWYGGPEAITRFGSLDLKYSPYASPSGYSGISVSSMEIGSLGLNGFFGLEKDPEIGHVYGAKADFDMEDIKVGSTIVRDDSLTTLVLNGSAIAMPGLKVDGVFANERANEGEGSEYLWTAKADYQLAPNMTVQGGYKYIGELYEARYVSSLTKDEDAEHDWVHLDRRADKGLFVGMQTEQQGVNIQANYDQMFEEAVLGADTEFEGFEFNVKTILDVPGAGNMATKSTEFGVAKEVDVMPGLAILASYDGEWIPADETLTHTLGASTTLGLIPAVNGLGLNGEVSFSEFNTESVGYKVGAEFEAPNGLNLGVEHERGEGTTMQAGMKIEF